MSKRILVVAVLAVVALLGYVAWRLFDVPPADPDGASGTVAHAEPPLPSAGKQGPTLRGAEDAHDDAGAGDLPGGREATPRAPVPVSAPAGSGPDAPAGDPPGPATITGTVTVGAWPAREGRVHVLLRGGAKLESVLDRDGRFEIVAPLSGSLTLSVSVPGRQPRTVQLHARPGANEPVEVAFGEGRIFGFVRDAQGSPLAGASVRLSTYLVEGDEGYAPSAEGDVFGMSVLAGDDGAYAFADLPPGRYVLVATTAPEGHDARNIRSFRVELAAGERRRLDIGAVYYDPTWTGTVRYGDGRAVGRSGSLFLQEEGGERRLYVSFDAEGRFAQEVPAGTYRLEIVLPGARLGWGMQLVQTAQTVTVHPSGADQDVLLPGVRVTGRARADAPPGEPTPERGCVVFTLESADGERPPSLIAREPTRRVRAAIAADGTFTVDGLPPGVWRVTGEPAALLDEDGRPARVTVTAGSRDVELVLVPADTGTDTAGARR